MKKLWLLLLCAAVAGCASGRTKIKAVSPNTEVVEAEGMAPVIGSDHAGARKTALHEAMKNALGMVVGVYVSQEALVSKAMLIEDNISSQTEGYIERYDVLKEWRDGEFSKVRIKALVRKEDLAAKLNALELEPKRLGNPAVKIEIRETVDGNASPGAWVESEIKRAFTDQGFQVSESTATDILVTGSAESFYNPDAKIGELVSYHASLSLKAIKVGSLDVIATASESMGGVDISREAAAKAALSNCAKRASRALPQSVTTYLRERSTMQLTVGNVEDVKMLSDFVRAVRAFTEVKDCRVRNYSGNIALVDTDVRHGTSMDLARRLEQMSTFRVKIRKTATYGVEAELVK